MFVSNVTPAIIVCGRRASASARTAGLSADDLHGPDVDVPRRHRELFQTIGFGPVGARHSIVQGTSFAFIPNMIPLVAGKGADAIAVLMGGILVGGLFRASLALFNGRLRFAPPPLVTGLVVTMIGLARVRVGIQYAAGGVPAIGTPDCGSGLSWFMAGTVIVVTLGLKVFTRGMLSVPAVLVGLLAGYAVAVAMGRVNLGSVASAAPFARPNRCISGSSSRWRRSSASA